MSRAVRLTVCIFLVGFLSGCCCGGHGGLCRSGCGPAPFGGCNSCGQNYGGAYYMPQQGAACPSCNQGGYQAAPSYVVPPQSFMQPYYGATTVPTTSVVADGSNMLPAEGVSSPGTYSTTLPQSTSTVMGSTEAQPLSDDASHSALGQPAPFGQTPVTTVLNRPESLATY